MGTIWTNNYKAFIVLVNNESIEMYPATQLRLSSDYLNGGKIECETYVDTRKVFKKENKYLPITEQDIAKLFCNDNEEIMKQGAEKSEQNYYTT